MPIIKIRNETLRIFYKWCQKIIYEIFKTLRAVKTWR